MKKNIFSCFFLVFFCSFASAQTADKLTAMIEAQNVSFNQAAYFASSYLGLGDENMSDAEAAKILVNFSSFSKLKNADGPLTVEEFAYFCARVWKIRGGISYTVSKSPRYALKELKALGFIPGFADPDACITGRDALHIMGKCADYMEKQSTGEAVK